MDQFVSLNIRHIDMAMGSVSCGKTSWLDSIPLKGEEKLASHGINLYVGVPCNISSSIGHANWNGHRIVSHIGFQEDMLQNTRVTMRADKDRNLPPEGLKQHCVCSNVWG